MMSVVHGKSWRRIAAALAVLGLAWLGLAGEARAAASPWAGLDEARVRLVAAAAGVGEAETVRLGLQFQMQEGWKISWRSPGDAGLPPVFDWAGSDNLASADISWPVPERFSVLGFETLGYDDEVVLPVTARFAEPGRPLRLQLSLNYLACREICVPAEAGLALALPIGPAEPTAFAHLIDRFTARVPGAGAAQGLSIERAVAAGPPEAPALTVVARSVLPFSAPDVFVEGPEVFRFGPVEVELGEKGTRADLVVPVEGVAGAPPPLAGTRLTLTLVDGGRAMERTMTALAAAPGAEPGARAALASASLGWELAGILGLALLGGLILNLMPCVLPVLSLKLLSVVGHGGGERAAVRLSFLASSGGIVFSFLVLAAVAVGLKWAGLAIGWGIQFQQPAFLTAMVLIVTLFAYNLWGLFEIRLPGWLADTLTHHEGTHSLGGHFLTGAFATLLATPCTAPFLGTAVGFAFVRGPVEIFAVFTALGLGLALPYLLVAAVPGLATHLPRPGHWMVTLRRALGVALALAALWLLTVLAVQVSIAAAYALAALVVGLGVALVLARAGGRMRAAALASVALMAVAAFAIPARFADRAQAPVASVPDGVWQSFERDRIPELVAAGEVVLVDVTAEWCLTCKVNKVLVLDQGEVARRLAQGEVVGLRADWTVPDDEIAAYLAAFGRYGIPFNAVYGPGAPQGIALPELLTEGAVLAAFARASQGGPAVRAASSEE
jgi:suppressor for copper-sensitivity B